MGFSHINPATVDTDTNLAIATGAEVDTGTNNTKAASPKAIADSKLSYTDGTETLSNKTLTAPTVDTSLTGSYLTASEILITDGSKGVVSAAVATYPSLTELSYVKGVTSAIQTQLGGKLSDVVGDTTPQLGGDLDAQDKNITGLGSVGFTQELDLGSKTASFSVDFGTDQKQKVTLTANTMTLTLDTTFDRVGNYLLKIVNGGLATLTWASESGAVYFPGGTDPALTSSGTDIVSFYYDGTNWYGVATLDFS